MSPPGAEGPLQDADLNNLWVDLARRDTTYQSVLQALRGGSRQVPTSVNLKIQLSDCQVDGQGQLRHRGKVWVPGAPFTTDEERKNADYELQRMDILRTKIIQRCHDSSISGHPGREGTISIVGRDYYWPLLSQHVRRFCRNCDVCGRSKVWRDLKNGLLKPLPVPDRFYQEISIDFIIDLPESNSYISL